MKRSELLAWLGGAALGGLGVSPAVARGNDDGSYRIQRAYYGTARRFVDVTDRLRELAQRDARFRLGNDTFGVDPAQGEVKALRIQAISSSGRSRTFEYIEGAVVDGAMFEGWGGGGWGGNAGNSGGWGERPGYEDGRDGEYVILRAQYGTAQRNVDVTDRLRELAARDERFRLSNSTFGVDPHPGQVKVLRIHARGPRGSRTFEYVEGGLVDGAQFSGWRGGGWGQGDWDGGWGGSGGSNSGQSGLVILRAEYGVGGRRVDITNRLQMRVVGNRLNVRVNNDLAGTDPADGRPKELRVRYRINGREERRTVPEGQRLSLP